MLNKRSILAGKVLLTAIVLFFSFYGGLIYVMVVSGNGADYYLSIVGAVLFPVFWIFLIFAKNRKKHCRYGP